LNIVLELTVRSRFFLSLLLLLMIDRRFRHLGSMVNTPVRCRRFFSLAAPTEMVSIRSNLTHTPLLIASSNNNYHIAVFGRVVKGMDVCTAIENAKTDKFDKPLDEIRIHSVDLE